MTAIFTKILSLTSLMHRIELIWKIGVLIKQNLPVLALIMKFLFQYSLKVITQFSVLFAFLLFYVYLYHPELWNFLLTYNLQPAPDQNLNTLVENIVNEKLAIAKKAPPFTEIPECSPKKDVSFIAIAVICTCICSLFRYFFY